MKLVTNWRAVLKHAWSVRLIAGGIVVMLLDALLPFLNLPIPSWVFTGLGVLLGVAAIGARLVVQQAIQTIITDPDWETGNHGHDHEN